MTHVNIEILIAEGEQAAAILDYEALCYLDDQELSTPDGWCGLRAARAYPEVWHRLERSVARGDLPGDAAGSVTLSCGEDLAEFIEEIRAVV